MSTKALKRLTERGVLADLLLKLESILSGQWWSNLVVKVDSDDLDGETHDWLGSVNQMTERKGDPRYHELELWPWYIKNREFEAGFTVKAGIWDHGKRGMITARINDQTTLAGSHPGELLQALILAGAATACYDGQYFFDTDHPYTTAADAAATQSNIVAKSVVSAAAPTVDETVDAILEAVQTMYGLKDDRGNSINLGLNKFKLCMPPAHWKSVVRAVNAKLLANGGSNVLAEGMDFTLSSQMLPATSGNKIWVLADDEDSAPFVWQVLDNVMPEVLGRDSEYCKLHKRLLFLVRAAYNMGYGRYQRAVEIQLSDA